MAGVPSDNTTLVGVLDAYTAEGFDGSFHATEDGLVRCQSCRSEMRPQELELASMRRLEGASDPADMLAVLALRCPRCGTSGTAVVNYGPEAQPGDGQVLLGLQDERPRDATGGRPVTED